MSVLRTFIGIAVFPFLAVIVMVIGFACAAAHAIALPGLYWWERYRGEIRRPSNERNPGLSPKAEPPAPPRRQLKDGGR